MTQAQLVDARDKARNSREGAIRAVRTAWGHVLFLVESTEPGRPFDLDHLALTARERAGVPTAVYEKASAKIKEALGGETLSTGLTELWPADRPHLPVAEVAEWFATYVYLPKLRDRVVLEAAIRDALAKLDPKFAYAERFHDASGKYAGLLWQKAPIDPMPPTALLVRPEVAMAQLRTAGLPPQPEPAPRTPDGGSDAIPAPPPGPSPRQQPRRFVGSVEIDMVRPVKSFEAIFSAVVVELQRTRGAKVRVTVDIEADAEDEFSEADIGVVRDNTRQLKFKAESTGFED
jgi:hypothetical protein